MKTLIPVSLWPHAEQESKLSCSCVYLVMKFGSPSAGLATTLTTMQILQCCGLTPDYAKLLTTNHLEAHVHAVWAWIHVVVQEPRPTRLRSLPRAHSKLCSNPGEPTLPNVLTCRSRCSRSHMRALTLCFKTTGGATTRWWACVPQVGRCSPRGAR